MSLSRSLKYKACPESPTLLPTNEPPLSLYQQRRGSSGSEEDVQGADTSRGRGTTTPCAGNTLGRCISKPVPCWTLIPLIAVTVAVGVVFTYFLSGHKSEPAQCPKDWILINRNCYFLSDDMKTWTVSEKFCNDSGGSLVIIQDNTEHDFKKLNMNKEFWIGLKRDQNGWKWTDGIEYNQTVDGADDSQLNCAYLNGKIGALVCDTQRRFICHKAVGS